MSNPFSPFDDLEDEAPAKAPSPSGPVPEGFDPFTAKAETAEAERLPELPEIAAYRFVREPATGRIGIVVRAGELEAEPNRDGPRRACIVAWLSDVSHPITTDHLQVL